MTRSEFRSLPAAELGEVAFDMNRYGYYIQGVGNDLDSKIHVCQYHIRDLVGTKLNDYSVYGMANKWNAAIADNPEARRWRALEDRAIALKIKINYITKRLEDIAKSILEAQRDKRQNRGRY